MAKQSQQTVSPPQQLNPLAVTVNGLGSLFSLAQPVALLLLGISIAGFISGMFNPSASNDPSGRHTEAFFSNLFSNPTLLFTVMMVVFIISVFSLVVGTMLHGMQSYTALQLSKGKKVGIRESFNITLENFGYYLILFVWMNIKIMLWSLLFIIPGIIASYRYSFAGIVFFDKNLKGEEAIKESNRLTKGGLLTIFASQFLFNLVTLFYAERLVSTASLSVLYREYTHYDKQGAKPSAHPLSWISLVLPFILFTLAVLLFITVFAAIGAYGSHTAP